MNSLPFLEVELAGSSKEAALKENVPSNQGRNVFGVAVTCGSVKGLDCAVQASFACSNELYLVPPQGWVASCECSL